MMRFLKKLSISFFVLFFTFLILFNLSTNEKVKVDDSKNTKTLSSVTQNFIGYKTLPSNWLSVLNEKYDIFRPTVINKLKFMTATSAIIEGNTTYDGDLLCGLDESGNILDSTSDSSICNIYWDSKNMYLTVFFMDAKNDTDLGLGISSYYLKMPNSSIFSDTLISGTNYYLEELDLTYIYIDTSYESTYSSWFKNYSKLTTFKTSKFTDNSFVLPTSQTWYNNTTPSSTPVTIATGLCQTFSTTKPILNNIDGVYLEDYITNKLKSSLYLYTGEDILVSTILSELLLDSYVTSTTTSISSFGLNSITLNTTSLYEYSDASTSKEFSITLYKQITEDDFNLSISETSYSGVEIKPEIISDLIQDTDYTITYQNNINAGEANIVIKGIGNYTGEVVKEFKIIGKNIENNSITLSFQEIIYTGQPLTPEVFIEGLKLDTDYTITYQNNINAGEASIIIKGINNCSGEVTKSFIIKSIDINTKNITLSISEAIFSGKSITPEVSIDGLTKDTDYTLTYQNNINAGEACVIINGINNYSNEVIKTFIINKCDLSNKTLTLEYSEINYTSFSLTPLVYVDGLNKDTDYTVSYLDNINAGVASIKVLGIGNYTGEINSTFTINKLNISDLDIIIDTKNIYYTGLEITPKVTIPNLKENTDYQVIYDNNINVGKASIIIEGILNVSGSILKTFKIYPKSSSIIQKDFNEITANDLDTLKDLLKDINDLNKNENTKEVLSDLENIALNEGYANLNLMIKDSLAKISFDEARNLGLTNLNKVLRVHDGEIVKDTLEDAINIINTACIYEKYIKDENIDDNLNDKLALLNETLIYQEESIKVAQKQNQTINTIDDDATTKISSKKYSVSQEKQINEIKENADDLILNIDKSKSFDMQKIQIDEIKEDTLINLNNVEITYVTKGDLYFDKTSTKNGELAEYENTSDIWGIIESSSGMSSKTTIKIDKTSSDAIDKINSAIKKDKFILNDNINTTSNISKTSNKELIGSLDIYLLNGDVRVTEFEGVYTVKILLDEQTRKIENLSIVYLSDESGIEIFNTTLEDSKFIVFNTTHFSEYYIISETQKEETNYLYLIIILLLINVTLIIGNVVIFINNKKNKLNTLSITLLPLLMLSFKNSMIFIIILSVCIIIFSILLFLQLKKK